MKVLHGSAAAEAPAPVDDCFALLADVEGYPRWYPEVVRQVAVTERRPDGRAALARVRLHVSVGPLARDVELLLAVAEVAPATVTLTRVPSAGRDSEQFSVAWRLDERTAGTNIELALDAELDVPRLVPTGGVGDSLAQGFVAAAGRALT